MPRSAHVLGRWPVDALLLWKILAIVAVFAAGVIGGLLPWRVTGLRRSTVYLGWGNAFAGGILLAAGFIHLLGDAAGGFAAVWPDVDYPSGTATPTRAEIVEIGEGFLDHTYPAKSFHHREHLIMTPYLRCAYPDRPLRDELPDLIRDYNVAQGGVNDADNGYHHTITLAYLDLILDVLNEYDGDDLEGACAAVLQSPAAAPDVLLTFWNRPTLFSREARAEWVEPDRQPLSLR